MNAFSPPSLLIVVGALSFAGFGCAAAPHDGAIGKVASAETSSAHVASSATATNGVKNGASGQRSQLAALVRAEDDDVDDNPRGVLLIGNDVFDSCASVREVHPKNDDAKAWLAIVKSVAHCVKDGELKSRNIVLHGPSRPQVIVKYIFSRLGVPEDRIEMSDTTGLPSCADDCDASDMRVEIGLAGTVTKEATVASLRSGM